MAAISHQGDDEKLATIRRLRFVDTNQSDKELILLFSNYGWIFIAKIINNTDNKVHFYNPYEDTSGDINAGESEESNCRGYLPLWSHDKRYEITYNNKALEKTKKILIKDLDGDWLASFYQEGNDEDIRELTSPPLYYDAEVQITLQNSGYELHVLDGPAAKRKGGMLCWGLFGFGMSKETKSS